MSSLSNHGMVQCFPGHFHQLARYLTVRHSEWAFVPVDKAGITDSLSR
jgi:hypothetical protein